MFGQYDRCPYCGVGLFCPWARCPYCHADFRGDTRYTCIGIRDESEYEKRLADLDMLSALVSAYENDVYPIKPPTWWARIRFRWDQSWRWKMQPALYGACFMLWLLAYLVT